MDTATKFIIARNVAGVVAAIFTVTVACIKLPELTRTRRLMKRIDAVTAVAERLPDGFPTKNDLFLLVEGDLHDLADMLGKRYSAQREQIIRERMDAFIRAHPRGEHLSESGRQFVRDEVVRGIKIERHLNLYRLAGMVFGITVSAAGLILSLISMLNGQVLAGVVLGVVDLLALTAAFVVSVREVESGEPSVTTVPSAEPSDVPESEAPEAAQ